ncbi:RDD family protein [compost metagenome]
MISRQKNYVGFWPRFFAFIIDIIVMFSFISILLSCAPTIYVLNTWLLKIAIAQSYFIVFTIIFNQTLGKMIVGIKVYSSIDERLAWEDLLLREGISKVVSALLFFIGYLMTAVDPKKQALHAHMTNTVVLWES